MKEVALGRLTRSVATILLCIAMGCGKGDGTKENAPPATAAQALESPAHNEPVKAVTPRLSRPMDRCQWNMATLTGSYLDAGHRDAGWDEAATNALSLFARIRCEG